MVVQRNKLLFWAFALCKEDEDGDARRGFLHDAWRRIVSAFMACAICRLMPIDSACELGLGILIWFLLDSGEAQCMVGFCPGYWQCSLGFQGFHSGGTRVSVLREIKVSRIEGGVVNFEEKQRGMKRQEEGKKGREENGTCVEASKGVIAIGILLALLLDVVNESEQERVLREEKLGVANAKVKKKPRELEILRLKL
ncbi:hypothetical protein V8G54_014263 [Vigna mungo]|uniref:Uncharacterized protein n=1 Tax=Vigna mungo TaxID=3915 RepID=A0AAQ3NJ18_VIGMU